MNLSQGTLLTLAILTLAYLPAPPPFVCIEEPDRGIHPRLLRDIKDALYRLSYPQAVGEQRAPVQVIVTTHSPYLLDLFRDHPEEIIVAEKHALDAVLVPLAVHPKLYEILEGAHLGAVWYSGILGGVPDTK
jgi:predicted ATPase